MAVRGLAHTALYSDAKFKKYAAMVERTLATFDNVSEWADFISFLSRLLKVSSKKKPGSCAW